MSIIVENATLDYKIYGSESRSLKKAFIKAAARTAGGSIMGSSANDQIVVRAVNDVSFTLQDGDRLALIGHNGAGKSTLLRCLAGVYPLSSGSIMVNGRISTFFDIALGLDPEATGRQNILFLGLLRGLTPNEIKSLEDEIIDFSGLGGFIEMPTKTYSSGMLGRLIFSLATAYNPDVLLMDEWLSAGDSSFIESANSRIEKVVSNSRIMVLASHSPPILRSFCNKGLVMSRGKAVFFGDIEEALMFDVY